MSNRRRNRRDREPPQPRGRTAPLTDLTLRYLHQPDDDRIQGAGGDGLTLAKVRQAFYANERRGQFVRGGTAKDGGRSYREWGLSSLARRHGWHPLGVTVSASAGDVTASGLLRARLPKRAAAQVRDGDLVAITDPATGAAGTASVRRVYHRTGALYLVPAWGSELQPARFRSQACARAQAREYPETCPACGAQPGTDCVTRSGGIARWPHRARDPLLLMGNFERERAEAHAALGKAKAELAEIEAEIAALEAAARQARSQAKQRAPVR